MRLIGIGTTPNQVYHRRDTAGSDRHMANAFFSDLLSTISERGRTLLRRGGSSDTRPDASQLLALCEALLSGRGEASRLVIAPDVFDGYHALDAPQRQALFPTPAPAY